jgi:catechol 2,3-dioxygenase-like lactoylglutathione lyase family enzyme
VSSTQLTDKIAPATTAEKLEVVTIPVSDVDRAKAFYLRLGWRLDIDFEPAPGMRGVQFTPPGSPTSIQFGKGTTTMHEPHQALLLVVDDITAARDDLISRGADVGEIFHLEPGKGPAAGLDPKRRSYFSRAVLTDPDGNQWQLQEVTDRLPGRVERTDPGPLAELLAETARHHGGFEAIAPPHNWWDWYAAYFAARQDGDTPAQADKAADAYMKEAYGVVVSR